MMRRRRGTSSAHRPLNNNKKNTQKQPGMASHGNSTVTEALRTDDAAATRHILGAPVADERLRAAVGLVFSLVGRYKKTKKRWT
jgi:hypothetical protein